MNLHFVRPHTLSPRAEVMPSYFGHLVQETEQIISEITANPPRLLALHVQPRQLVYEFNYSAPLSAVEQRAIVRRLHAKRRKGQWIEEQHLAVQYTGFSNTAVVNDMIGETKRWMPVMNNGRTTVWWPLRQNQHVVLAGSVEKIVTGFLEHIRRLPEHQQPTMILHDADDRLVAINDTLASLRSSPDALAQARSLQLAHQFDERHEHHMSNAPMPVCIVVAPSATDWPDVQPLLSAKSGVQVVLVLGEGVPIAPLRAVCHQLWMIHTPDSRFATLPDAFRPAGLPTTRDGRVLAWSPGGRTVWQGTPLQQAPTVHSPCEDEERGS